MEDFIKNIVDFCKPQNYGLICGDMFEINNYLNEHTFPTFILETDYAFDLEKTGTGYKRVVSFVVGVLDKTQLEDIDKDRENAFTSSMNAFEAFIMNLEKVRFDLVNKVFTEINGNVSVVDSIENVKGTRVKNKFSANTDGILSTNITLILSPLFNKCLQKSIYDK